MSYIVYRYDPARADYTSRSEGETRTGYGIPAHDGVGSGGGEFFRRRRRPPGRGGADNCRVFYNILNIVTFFRGVFFGEGFAKIFGALGPMGPGPWA